MATETRTAAERAEYTDHAKQWILEFLFVAAVGEMLKFFVVPPDGGASALLLAFAINAAVAVVVVFLLFRHIDDLVAERIARATGPGGDGAAG